MSGIQLGFSGFSGFKPPPVVLDGLQLYVDAGNILSYPTTGTTWTDLSGNGNNGTLTNGPTYSSANGGAIVFDGTNDHVYKGTFAGSITTNLSLSVWVLFSSLAQGAYVMALGRDVGGTAGGLALFAILSGIPIFELGSGKGRVSSGITPTLNTWYNFAVTADGTNTKFYVNSTLANTSAQSTGQVASSPGFCIGSYINSYIPPVSSGVYHNGKIANVKIYNRALSTTEVAQNFNALRGRFGI